MNEREDWIRSKLIVPVISEATGRGTRRLFDILDLKLRWLRKEDWKPEQVAKALSVMEAVVEDPNLLHILLLIHENNMLLIFCRN